MPCDNTKTSSEIEHVDWSTGTGSGHHYANVRFGSGSSQASQSSGDICRICHCESDPQNPLLTPCYCAGSLKYVHQACLQQWLTASETNSCELCKFPFIMHTKIKPFNEWRSLDISGIERRRLCCSVLFHCAAALCVIWSLCVLIERAADDVKRGLIDWPFWTKLAVVTVGLTGGVVFMYIQCKAYLHLCHRWKARNRILLIQNAPEKVHPISPPSPAVQHRNSRHGGGVVGCSSAEVRSSSCAANAASRGIDIGGTVEVSANVASAAAAHGYNYATSVGGVGSASADGSMDAADAAHQQHAHHMHSHTHQLPSSPHHMLQQVDLDMDPLASSTAGGVNCGGVGSHHQQTPPPHHLSGGGAGIGGIGGHQLGQQVAVSANIECSQSQQNYERDWALDDVVSQISSFRPCPQGSGSMTPFHDSIHNVLEHSESSSRGSVNGVLCLGGSRQDLSTGGASTDTGGRGDLALQMSSFSGSGEHKAPSISSGVSNAVANGLGGFVYKPHNNNGSSNTKRYSNSSIFLENRDILNDSSSLALGLESSSSIAAATGGGGSDYPKMNYRHSSMLTTPPDDDYVVEGAGGSSDQLEKFLGKDLRRYSDTKLLASSGADATPAEAHDPMLFNTAVDTVLDLELPTSPLSPPAAYARDRRQQRPQQPPPTLRRSMHTVLEMDSGGGGGGDGQRIGGGSTHQTVGIAAGSSAQQIDKARLFFKSLPNLSSSCESLIKK